MMDTINNVMGDLKNAQNGHIQTLRELVTLQSKINNFIEALSELKPPQNHPLVTTAWCDCYDAVAKLVRKHL